MVNGFHIGKSRYSLNKVYELHADPAGLEVDGDVILHCDMNFDFRLQDDLPLASEASTLTPRSVTLTLGWWQDGEVKSADRAADFLDGILQYLHRDTWIIMRLLTDIIVKPYVRVDRPDGHAYCLPGAIEPVIEKHWRPNIHFQSECKCGNGKKTGCEFEAGHLDEQIAYSLSATFPVWDNARQDVFEFFTYWFGNESSDDEA